MRIILLLLISFILVDAFQQCNNTDDNLIVNNFKQNQEDTLKDDPKPCCNSGLPSSCVPPFYMGINTECGEVQISCECCYQIWDYYGGKPPAPETIPCNIVNVAGCYETRH
jgi:hypothetical protein